MMEKYDEDLYENPFFITLQNQFHQLYEAATEQRQTLCIPKYSSVLKQKLVQTDIEDHIISLSPDENGVYKTWSQKNVTIKDGEIRLNIGKDAETCVKILFEETFYNNNDKSYKVVCVECLINREQKADDLGLTETVRGPPKIYDECIALLFTHSGGKRTQDHLDKQLESFAETYSKLASAKLSQIVNTANTQFTKAMQLVLKDSFVRRNAQESKGNMDNLKIAVELYLMHSIHRQMFQAIMTVVSTQDTSINKSIRSLKDIKLKDLGIRSEFSRSVKLAKKELLRISTFSTPLGRLMCVKRVVSLLSSATVKSSDSKKEESVMMTTDDFLPIMIYLIIMSEIPNWQANLKYMKHFSFSRLFNYDEYMFYLTTIEAAIEHICSGRLQQDAIRSYKVKVTKQVDPHTELNRQSSVGTTVDRFFHYVQCGDEAAVRLLLGKSQNQDNDITEQMCHPLCACEKCSKLQNQVPTDVNLVTAYTRDDRGYTALHIAALHGQAHLIDLLIHHGAVVNASDYLSLTPLHLACQKGYQNIILLLIHFGADCTLADGAGNSPLHLCVDGGHEDCVKALVFADIRRTKININAQNSRGDTPLHIAAKWGYETIITILLENHARLDIKNRKKQLPTSLAQNANIQAVFTEFQMQPELLASRRKSESVTDYEFVTVTKPKRPEDVKFNPTSSSSLITPEVASLDEVDYKLVDKLFRAIEDGDIQMVCFYMRWNNSPGGEGNDSTAEDSMTLCHPLCQCSKCLGIPESEVSRGSSLHVNIKNQTGYTPLMKAVQGQKLDLVELFIKHGAKVNTQNHKKITALHIACYFGNSEIAILLLQNGANVNITDGHGDTPLHLSCSKGCDTLVHYLLQYKVNVKCANSVGNTALHIAVKYGNIKVVKILLEEGVNPMVRNKDNLIPLNYARDPEVNQILSNYMKKQSFSPKQAKSKQEDWKSEKEVSEEPHHISIKTLYPAFEDKDVESLRVIGSSIKDFDPKESLRKTSTKDCSAPNLRPLRHSLSIQNFDFSVLKHVESLDKSEPLYIYKLAVEGIDHEKKGKTNGEDSDESDVFTDIESPIQDDIGISSYDVECDKVLSLPDKENESLLTDMIIDKDIDKNANNFSIKDPEDSVVKSERQNDSSTDNCL